MTSQDAAGAFSALGSLFWRERELLELLEFRLTAQNLVLQAGAVRWLAPANREIEAALSDIRAAEVVRETYVQQLADQLGRSGDLGTGTLTLGVLTELAPEPWPMLLSEHGDALRRQTERIERLRRANEELLAATADGVERTLHAMQDALHEAADGGPAARDGSA